MKDEYYMERAITLAEGGVGYVSPNPLVGAVIVKEDEIIGEGYHRQYGNLHAEREALKNCKESAAGATIYVTLEPCCHYGKQPPCTEAIIEAGIKKVVIGANDPNPLVAGKGVKILKEHGIEVVEHVLEEKCLKQNEVFFHYMKTKRPFVVMKYAMTMDGKIATYTGKSKWITGEEARKKVHFDRHRYSGIMVGIGTVRKDDPLLNCRLRKGKNPTRIICDTNLTISSESQIVKTAKEIPTIIVTCREEKKLHEPLEKAGCRVIVVSKKETHIDLQECMDKLGEIGIDSILLEGGGELHWSALKEGIVKRVQTYIAPKIFGGMEAISPVTGEGVENPELAVKLVNSRMKRVGDDFLIESEVE